MRISVTVSHGKDRVEEHGEALKVYTKEPFENNMANRDIIKQIARHYSVGQENVRIVKGFTAKRKIIEIDIKSPFKLHQ